MKTCSKCAQAKPFSEYYKRPESADGYRAQCKDCKYRSKYTGPTERSRAASAAWRAKNPGYAREYRQQNLEAIREREREYDRTHCEERRRYYTENIHVAWENDYRRRAISPEHAANLERFTRADLMAHLGLSNWACVKCGTTQGVELDHIIPVSLGGPHTVENCRPLCGPHNREAWHAVRARVYG